MRVELTRFLLLWKPDVVLQNDRKQEGIIRSDESLEVNNNAELIAYTGTPFPTAYVSLYRSHCTAETWPLMSSVLFCLESHEN